MYYKRRYRLQEDRYSLPAVLCGVVRKVFHQELLRGQPGTDSHSHRHCPAPRWPIHSTDGWRALSFGNFRKGIDEEHLVMGADGTGFWKVALCFS